MWSQKIINIFYTSNDPQECATVLDDKRLIVSIHSVAQILSNAMHINGDKGPLPMSHKDGRHTKWIANNSENFMWSLDHLAYLCDEYKWRFKKNHPCGKLIPIYDKVIPILNYGIFSTPPNDSLFKHIQDTTFAYKIHLKYRWKNKQPKWTLRHKPKWYITSKSA